MIYYFCNLLVFPTKQVNLITSHLLYICRYKKINSHFCPPQVLGFWCPKNAKGTFNKVISHLFFDYLSWFSTKWYSTKWAIPQNSWWTKNIFPKFFDISLHCVLQVTKSLVQSWGMLNVECWSYHYFQLFN